jgi:hypothetical protein
MDTYQHDASPEFTSFEGYIAGRLFCAVVREVKGVLTRESFIRTMEEVGRFELGGLWSSNSAPRTTRGSIWCN